MSVDNEAAVFVTNGRVYWSFAGWLIALGAALIAAPASWYGRSWSYFPQLPHNGFWMGIVCVVLGIVQLFVVWRNHSRRTLAVLLALAGFVFWTAGIILGAEGILGHGGLMEAPFMMYVGAHKFAHSASLWACWPSGPVRS